MSYRNCAVVVSMGLLLALAACGGGGGSGDSSSTSAATSDSSSTTGGSSTTTSTTVVGYLVDGPVKGVSYTCNPSGLNGTTSATGAFTCNSGDTVTFTLSVGGSSISLGSVAVPNSTGTSVPVTMLANGLQVAEILQALNHGTTTDMDVSGLTIPASVVAEINSYISSGGATLSGQASDDQFLAYVQGQISGVTTRTTPVTGSGTTFRENTVLPNLQTTLIGISSTNPAFIVKNNTSKLSGSILVTGSGSVTPVSGCTTPTWTATGGGIVNAVVAGDIQTPGTYDMTINVGSFRQVIYISGFSCTSGNITTSVPAQTVTSTASPFADTGQITVAKAFSGNTLTMPNSGVTPPAGCTGGGDLSGSDVGLSNPLITLTSTLSCDFSGAKFTITETAKLVGAW